MKDNKNKTYLNHKFLGELVFPSSALGDIRYISGRRKPYYETFKLFEKRINDGCVFYDIGAHFGCISLQFLNLMQEKEYSGKLRSFEVNPIVFECLEENLKRNTSKNVQIKAYHRAISNINNTKIDYNIPSPLTGEVWSGYGSFGIENGGPRSDKYISVDTMSIDSMKEKVDIIKLDVEGYEKKVLLGMSETLKEYKPLLIIELNNNSEKDHGFIVQYLRDNNYKAIARNTKEDFLFSHKDYT